MGKKPKLLIIDDEADLAELLGDMLEESFDCETLSEPASIAPRLSRPDYEAVLTDLNMPSLSGADVVLLVRSASQTIPVFLLTGSTGDHPEIQRAMELGASGLVSKPFDDTDEISTCILQAIRSASST